MADINVLYPRFGGPTFWRCVRHDTHSNGVNSSRADLDRLINNNLSWSMCIINARGLKPLDGTPS